MRLDDFEKLTGWGALESEGVRLQIAQDNGHTGMGMRVDFDFREGPGFIVVRKLFSILLPDNYAFSFYLRGEAPPNNVEFKLVDPSGQNVWWYRKRSYRFPTEWRKVTVKKRQLEFAWGPAGGGGIKQVGALEFALSVGSGGKGTVWIDGLNFEPLEPPSPHELTPTVSASTSLPTHPPAAVLGQDPATSWKSGSFVETQWLLIDFLKHREFGGLVVDWDPEDFATEYNVQISNDGIEWTRAYSVTAGNGRRDYIPLPDAESHYLKLELVQSSRGQGYGIRAATMKPEEATRFWKAELDRVDIHLPTGLEDITNTVKSTVAYILINRDGYAIQPSPRCYARSWIRDGALTSTALLEMGYPEEVRNFIRWYTRYQSEQGKIPCCIDHRGPDPVPENDSPGEFIYLVMEYYRYTRDVGLLTEVWPNVVKAVEYIDTLRQQRMTKAFKTEDKLPFYGLVPESISHEGYSSGPVHSYWDDFWVLRGLKDAASMAAVVGDEERRAQFAKMCDDFRNDLYESISRTLARHKIVYLPGSVELGDFDPTSTAIAVVLGGEQQNLPEAALTRTFEQYTEFFIQRQKGEVTWNSYTPYELRNVGALVRLGRRTFAFEALSFFLKDRRPVTWNHWAEVVWRDPKTPRFIGDMPHTWVGSEYMRSIRSLFVFEREADHALVIGAGLPREWVENSTGVTVKCLPTYYGHLNYSLYSGEPGELRLSLSGDLIVPPGKIVLQPPLGGPLKTMTVNGKDLNTFDAQSASITEFPAEVVLKY